VSDVAFEFRCAARRLRTRPTATMVALCTLAIGVGANTATFGIIRALLLKPLPYADASRLVALTERWPGLPDPKPISRMNYRDWAALNTVLEQTAVDTWDEATVTGGGMPVHLSSARVSWNYFNLFGLRAALGRTFVADDEQPGRGRVVVLSHRLWLSQFAADPSVIGRAVRLDDELYTVIGVMPIGASVTFGATLSDPALWRPLVTEAPPARGVHDLRLVVGRLKAGVSIDQARADMDRVAASLAALYPETNHGYGVMLHPLTRPVGFDVASSLYLLFAASAIVLLLACVNLANLALARGSADARDAAIRVALGGTRVQIVRQILMEHLIISVAGGVGGIAIAYGVIATLKHAIPVHGFRAAFPEDTRIAIDVSVWTFAFTAATLSAMVCGLVPAIRASGSARSVVLRDGSGGSGTSRSQRRMQRVLVAAQLALSFTLLCGAALLIQSLEALTRQITSGFDSNNLLTMKLPIPPTRFAQGEAYNAYLDQIALRVQSVPVVRRLAFADSVPTEGIPYGKLFQIVGEPTVAYANRPLCGFKVVSPLYFATVGMRLVEGRSLEPSDRDTSGLVALINQSMARTFFRGASPIGRHVLMRRNPIQGPPGVADFDWTIVGVVANEGVSPIGHRTPTPTVYVTREQYPRLDLALVVKAANEPTRAAGAIRAAITAVDPTQAITDVKTVTELESDDTSPERLRSVLLSTLAGIAVFLATLGVYGVIAFVVMQRTRELGIRSALGATAGSLVMLVMRQGAAMMGCGLGAGVVTSVVALRLLKTFLFGITPSDPFTLTAVAALLGATTLLASYLPARRATNIDPVVVLRAE
jgi:putative ABC transport system permease protein